MLFASSSRILSGIHRGLSLWSRLRGCSWPRRIDDGRLNRGWNQTRYNNPSLLPTPKSIIGVPCCPYYPPPQPTHGECSPRPPRPPRPLGRPLLTATSVA